MLLLSYTLTIITPIRGSITRIKYNSNYMSINQNYNNNTHGIFIEDLISVSDRKSKTPDILKCRSV